MLSQVGFVIVNISVLHQFPEAFLSHLINTVKPVKCTSVMSLMFNWVHL